MAILAAVLVPTVTNKIDDANKSSAVSEMGTIASSINAAYMSNQTKETPATTYAGLVAAQQEEIGKYNLGNEVTKHGNYKIKIEYVAAVAAGTGANPTPATPAGVKISVMKGDTSIDSKFVALPGYIA